MSQHRVPIQYLIGGFALIILLLAVSLALVPNTLIPLLVSMGLAYAFDPLIDYFENKGFRRRRVIFWFFLVVASVGLVFITILVPFLVIQFLDFLETLNKAPELVQKGLTWVSERFDVDTSTLKEQTSVVAERLYSAENLGKIAAWGKTTVDGTTNFLKGMLTVILVPFFFYYFLLDIDRMRDAAFHMIPPAYQPFARVRLQHMNAVLSGFIRGQITVALTLSVLYSIGLSLVGIRYGMVIGILSGLLNIIPYLGVGLGFAASLFMAFFSGSLLHSLLGVVIVFGVVQVLEGFVITPRIVGDSVGLSPLSVLVLILIGGELFGIAGMLVGVPVGAVVRFLYRDLKAAYLRSPFYRRP